MKHADDEHEFNFYLFNILVCCALTIIAGVMSGLTIGLNSLDMLKMKLLKHDATASDSDKARVTQIEPLLRNHHLLLVTLLLANSAAMEALPLFLDAMVPSWAAIAISVTVVLIFGEILPQSFATRQPLKLAALAPFVWICIALLFPISYPIAKILDWLVGTDERTSILFKRSELNALFDLYTNLEVAAAEALQPDVVLMLKGAHSFKDKTVEQVPYTHANNILMLNVEACIDQGTIKEITHSGFSRIPVFRESVNNIMGVLLVKRLIGIDPDKACSISSIELAPPMFVPPSMPLRDLLNEFQTGKMHLALITNEYEQAALNANCPTYQPSNDPCPVRLIGMITLEEVIEVLIGERIWDETDEIKESESQSRQAKLNNETCRGGPYERLKKLHSNFSYGSFDESSDDGKAPSL